MTKKDLCPCGTGNSFDACCEPYIKGTAPAPTAEALMRSRYSAYAKCEIDYIRDTLKPEDRGVFDAKAAKEWAQNSTWLGLTINATKQGTESDTTGVVDFTAAFEVDGERQEHSEVATFYKEDGQWIYDDGKVRGAPTVRRETPKVGRNEPCPCNSGKKYKKCCGR